MPADNVTVDMEHGELICFNTPKGHVCLQTMKELRASLDVIRGFNTPKGHVCLQTISLSNVGYLLQCVSIPRRVTYACRHSRESHTQLLLTVVFQYPEGSRMPADSEDGSAVFVACEFQYPEGSRMPADARKYMTRLRGPSVSIPRRVTYACRLALRDAVCRYSFGFNTPKGHVCLQTAMGRGWNTSSPNSFNTPKGHVCLQTFTHYKPAGLTSVSIPRRVTYACRPCPCHGRRNAGHQFQYPEGSRMPADGPTRATMGARMKSFNTPKGHVCLQTPVPVRYTSMVTLGRMRVKCPSEGKGRVLHEIRHGLSQVPVYKA